MNRKVPLVSFAIQSKAPVVSNWMLDNKIALMAAYIEREQFEPIIFDYNTLSSIQKIKEIGREQFIQEIINNLNTYVEDNNVETLGLKLFSNGFKDSVEIAHQLKQHTPSLQIVGFGPQVGRFRETIFDYVNETYNNSILDTMLCYYYNCTTTPEILTLSLFLALTLYHTLAGDEFLAASE